jgi:DNA-binding transcriptional MocR family regulator
MGKVGDGDRLPSVRQMALRNSINHKTAFSIYQRLHLEGYITLRLNCVSIPGATSLGFYADRVLRSLRLARKKEMMVE